MTVITHDFGKERRQATRRFRELLSLDALHEANVRANPLPYLERASERIYQLEKALFEAVLASKPQPGEPACTERMEVDKGEYQRLLACRQVIEDALAKLRPDDEDDLAPR